MTETTLQYNWMIQKKIKSGEHQNEGFFASHCSYYFNLMQTYFFGAKFDE